MIFNEDSILLFLLQANEESEDLDDKVISYCEKGLFEQKKAQEVPNPPVIYIEYDPDTSPADVALEAQKKERANNAQGK